MLICYAASYKLSNHFGFLLFQERDWKLEKLQLNMQTFKSVGSLKVSEGGIAM